MLKLCQLITAFAEDWIIVVLSELLLMTALPDVRSPPIGKACTFSE
jgi:hypothetical protein